MEGYEKFNFSEVFWGPFIGFGIFALFIFLIDINYYIANNPVTDPSVLFGILVNNDMVSLVLLLLAIGITLSFVIGVAIMYPILRFFVGSEEDSITMSLRRFNFVYGYEAVLYIVVMNILSSHLSNIAPSIYEPVYIPSYTIGSSLSLWFLIGLMTGFIISRLSLFVLYIIRRKQFEIKAYKRKTEKKAILEKLILGDKG